MSEMLEVKNLKKYFKTPKGMLHAVDDVTFSVGAGKTMGVVGESGCGKSTLGRTIVHLLDSDGGKLLFEGRDITNARGRMLKKLRTAMQIVFQDPFSSLDPRFTVERAIQEPLRLQGNLSKEQIRQETERVMDLVGVDARLRHSYPHELDGGRRQRVVIARAMAPRPKFILCDEPVSALDVSIQAQVLNLLQDLQEQMGLTYIFITHDMSVVKHISDHICVMYLGQLVETASVRSLFGKPLHPYTRALLSAVPSTNIHHRKSRVRLQGELTSPINPNPGCRFAARCPYACAACEEPQPLVELEEGHFVACCQTGRIAG